MRLLSTLPEASHQLGFHLTFSLSLPEPEGGCEQTPRLVLESQELGCIPPPGLTNSVLPEESLMAVLGPLFPPVSEKIKMTPSLHPDSRLSRETWTLSVTARWQHLEGHGAEVRDWCQGPGGPGASQEERAARPRTQLTAHTDWAPEPAHLRLPFASLPLGLPHRTRCTPIRLPLPANRCKAFRTQVKQASCEAFPDKSPPPVSQTKFILVSFVSPAPLTHSLIVTLTIPDSERSPGCLRYWIMKL